MMSFILSLCLIIAISSIGVFAAAQKGFLDFDVIKDYISKPKDDETIEENEELSDNSNQEIVIEPEKNGIVIEEHKEDIVFTDEKQQSDDEW